MTVVVYRDFPLRVWRDPANQLKVGVSGLSPGEMLPTEPENLVFSPDLFKIPETGVDLLEAIKLRQVKEDGFCRVGTILADLILPGKIRENFRDSLQTVINRKQRLRLRLILQVDELKTLPWEYLYLAPKPGVCDVSGFLALQQNISIVRHEDLSGPEPAAPQGGTYRMVAALASPLGQPRLDLESDRTAIRSALRSAPQGVSIEATWVDPATCEALEEALKTPCDIFHFSGHGYFDETKNTGALLLEGEDKKSKNLPAYKLSQLLKDANTKVTILSACETAQRTDTNSYGGVAAALVVSGMPAVVASQYTLRDKNALAATNQLYASLVSGESIDDGVYQARKKILQQSTFTDRDWGALVLYLRVENGVVFPRVTTVPVSIVGPRVSPLTSNADLIGREAQLRTLDERLKPGVHLSFWGIYGVGKTSLAAKLFACATAGDRFKQGYVWRPVGNASPERALELLAAEFPGQLVSKAATLDEKVEAFKTLLKNFPAVLFGLDEVPDGKVARAVLDAAGGCTVVMNSTARLSVAGSEDVEVEVLSVPDARNLFISLSRLKPAGEAELMLVDKICNRMGCLPLGIKLAAFKCAEGESLNTLWDRLISAPETIPTEEVRRLFKATFDQLATSPCAQRLLVRIASFPANEASLDALRANENKVEFFQAKDKLIALGLLDPSSLDRVSQHPLLNVLSDTAAYGSLIASERGYVEAWLESFAKANRANPTNLAKEQNNLLGLLNEWSEGKDWKRIIALLRNLFDYLRLRGLWAEALDRIEVCLANEQYLNDPDRGWALLHSAILYTLLGDYRKASYNLSRAKERFAADSDRLNLGRTRYRLAVLAMMIGDMKEAMQELQVAIDAMVFSSEEAGADLAGAYARLAAIFAQQANRVEADKQFQMALRQAERIGDLEERARAHLGIGAMYQATDPKRALVAFNAALDLAKCAGDDLQVASIRLSVGYQNYYAGRNDEARTDFDASLNVFQRFAYQPGIARAQVALGNVELAEKRYSEADVYYRAALKISQMLGDKSSEAYTKYQRAIVAHAEGRRDDAERVYQECATFAKTEVDRVLEAASFAQLAKVKLENGDQDEAERCARKAEELAGHLEDLLTHATALDVLAYVSKARGDDLEAQQKWVAASSARAAILGVQLQQSILDGILFDERPLQQPSTISPSTFRVSNTRVIPDRILPGGNVQTTFTTREPKGGSSGGGGDFGGFGGGGILP